MYEKGNLFKISQDTRGMCSESGIYEGVVLVKFSNGDSQLNVDPNTLL